MTRAAQGRRPSHVCRYRARGPGPADRAWCRRAATRRDRLRRPGRVRTRIRALDPQAEIRDPEATPADTAKAMLTEARAGASVVRLVAGDVFIDDHARPRGSGRRANSGAVRHRAGSVDSSRHAPRTPECQSVSVHSEADLRQMEAADFDLLARSPGTLLLTVPADQVTYVGAQLVSCGLKPDTPVTLTSDGTGTGQHTATATAGELELAVAGMTGTVVVAIGRAAAQREKLGWWEARPLYGWKVLVPRTKDQAGAMSQRLRAAWCGTRRGADHRGRAAADADPDGAGHQGPGHRPVRVDRLHLDERGAGRSGEVRGVRPGRSSVCRREDRLRRRDHR